jgi:hypothetical protein
MQTHQLHVRRLHDTAAGLLSIDLDEFQLQPSFDGHARQWVPKIDSEQVQRERWLY